jgi:lysophospholipase L1-like esterase
MLGFHFRLPRATTLAATLAATLAVATLACGASPTRTAVVVAVMGSSTAAGVGASAGNGWVDRVRAAAATGCPQVTVSNLAFSGSVTWNGLPASAGSPPAGRPAPRLDANLDAALALKPALVLVQYPSNDAASYYPLAETLANHGILRDGIRAAGATDVILGPFPRGFTEPAQVALMTGLRDALPAVASPRYLDLWTDLAATDSQVIAAYGSGDGIHLGDAGHALIAAKVLASDAWKATCKP